VFKVIEFCANQESVYDFLLVINSNLGPISFHPCDGWMNRRTDRQTDRIAMANSEFQVRADI